MSGQERDRFVKEFAEAKENARKEIQYMKRHVPQVFAEWQNLKSAETAMEGAKRRLEVAKNIWEAL